MKVDTGMLNVPRVSPGGILDVTRSIIWTADPPITKQKSAGRTYLALPLAIGNANHSNLRSHVNSSAFSKAGGHLFIV